MAQDVITLAASTTYWITVNEGISSSNRARVFGITIGNGQTGETGWTIGNAPSMEKLAKRIAWVKPHHKWSLLITIKGTAIPPIYLGQQHASECDAL